MHNALPLDDIRAALEIERRASAQNPNKDEKVGATIRSRRPCGDGQGQTIEMKLDRPLPESGDKLVLEHSKEYLDAELVSTRLDADGSPILEVAAATPLPQNAKRVQVWPAQDSLLVAVDEVLAALTPATDDLLARLADPTAEPRPLSLKHLEPNDLAAEGKSWNADQARAIHTALTQDVTYVWGPPGTGKTQVLGAVVEGAVRQGHRVLFLAPTKVAVDQALLRIAERLEHYEGFDSGLVQRLGKVELPALSTAYGSYVDRDQIRARLNGAANERISALTKEREDWAGLAAAHAERDRLGTQMISLQKTREQTQRAIESATDTGFSRLMKKMSGITYPTPEELASLSDRLNALDDFIANTGRELDTLGPVQRGENDAESQLSRIDDQVAELKKDLHTVDQRLAETLAVAGTTLDGAAFRHIEAGRYDTVVIDEVGMVPYPKAVAGLSMAAARVVMIGDFRQLPAVIKGESTQLKDLTERARYKRWYERDIFSIAGLVSSEGTVVDSSKLVSLQTQYRMRSGICDLVNAVAYPDRPLLTGRKDEPGIASALLAKPLVLVDTSDVPRGLTGRDPRVNPVHAAVAREVLRRLQAGGVLPGRRTENVADHLVRTLGIIAPYRAQVKRLASQVDERFGVQPNGVVDTVHRYQGSERPVMLVDTVAHNGTETLGWFYRGVTLDSTTTRLLNVALSRAQDQLIVIADSRLLTSKADSDSGTRRMIEHLIEHAEKLPARDLIPVRSASELGSLSGEDLLTPAFFTADETPAAVEWDIAHARRKVEIFSPFISGPTFRQRFPALKAARARGVEITLWTRVTTVADQRTAIDSLKAVGVTVEERDQMHEKVIVIDGEICWHGSYNYLQHTRATELMLRMVDPVAAHEALNTMHRARPTKPVSEWSQRSRSATPLQGDRVPLTLSFYEKDTVKALGARWDGKAGKWWVTPELLATGKFDRWT